MLRLQPEVRSRCLVVFQAKRSQAGDPNSRQVGFEAACLSAMSEAIRVCSKRKGLKNKPRNIVRGRSLARWGRTTKVHVVMELGTVWGENPVRHA